MAFIFRTRRTHIDDVLNDDFEHWLIRQTQNLRTATAATWAVAIILWSIILLSGAVTGCAKRQPEASPAVVALKAEITEAIAHQISSEITDSPRIPAPQFPVPGSTDSRPPDPEPSPR